jgi:hypothetical protein
MPRPPAAVQAAAAQSAPGAARRQGAASARPQRLIDRDAPFVLGELKRIALVSGICMGLLGILVAIDRLG